MFVKSLTVLNTDGNPSKLGIGFYKNPFKKTYFSRIADSWNFSGFSDMIADSNCGF